MFLFFDSIFTVFYFKKLKNLILYYEYILTISFNKKCLGQIMAIYDNPFEILPVKPGFTKKQINKAKKPFILRYFPDKSSKTNDEKLNKKIYEKYHEYAQLLNAVMYDYNDGLDVFTQTDYDSYVRRFRLKLNRYSKEDLEVILKANDIEKSGNKEQLKNEVLRSIPSKVAELNIWEFNEKKKLTERILKRLSEKDLKKILKTKRLSTKGNKNSLIQSIVLNFTENEINSLIEQIKEEELKFKTKLQALKVKQLKLLLSNENLSESGNKNALIDRILENIDFKDLDEKIKEVSVNKEKALEKFYDIVGKTSLKKEFKEKLNKLGLLESHFTPIKEEMINLIEEYEISPENVEKELNKRLKQKSNEIELETLDELYRIVGKTRLNPIFLNRLKDSGLDESIGEKIKSELVDLIKAKEIKKDDVFFIVNTKIKEYETKIEKEKIELLYSITGETRPSAEFSKKLAINDLNEDIWKKINEEILELIKQRKIDKDQIKPRIDEILNIEIINHQLEKYNLATLNQLSILNNITTVDNKEEQIRIIINSLSDSFNQIKINSDLLQISNLEKDLNSLYKMQLEYILEINNLDSDGGKAELVNRIISALHINLIKLYYGEFRNANQKLKQSTLNQLSYILSENNLKIKGSKDKLIKEIIKNIRLDILKENLKEIDEINNKLSKLNQNELKYILESNNLNLLDETLLIEEIQEYADLKKVKINIQEITYIKQIVPKFNEVQRKHLLKINNLNIPESKEDQINEILEHADLKEIPILEKKLNKVEKELNELNVNQLYYILEKNNQEITLDKEKQIKVIIENIIIEAIETSISIIKGIKNDLNDLNKCQIEKILKINNLELNNEIEENISRVLEIIPIDTIKNNIKYVKELDECKEKKSIFISILKENNGKFALSTVKYKNLKLLPLFDEESIYNEFVQNNYPNSLNITEIKKNIEYYKGIVLRNEKIDGILLMTNTRKNIIKKEDFDKFLSGDTPLLL